MQTKRPQDLARWHFHNIEMHIGPWKRLLPEESVKILIAKAFSACVSYNNMKINGYLITKRRVFLLLNNSDDQLLCLGNAFFYSVESIVSQYFKGRNEEYIWHDYKKRHPEFVMTLFKSRFLMNRYVERIICKPHEDRKVDRIIDPKYKRLKEIISNYNYCSSIDYSGAIGPVDFLD